MACLVRRMCKTGLEIHPIGMRFALPSAGSTTARSSPGPAPLQVVQISTFSWVFVNAEVIVII
jgi:hypothetical protein